MAASNLQSVPLQLEAVRKKVVVAFGTEKTLYNKIKSRGDVIDASTRNIRLPQLIRPGGKGSQGTGDMDDMGRGSGSTWEVGTLSTLQFRWVIEISKLAEYATDEKSKAVDSVPAREVAQAVENFQHFLDAAINTSGNTQLDTISSIASGTAGNGLPCTLNITTPDMFWFNQDVLIYPIGLASAARGIATITFVDPAAVTIGVNQLPAGSISTDAICYNVSQGAGGANPVGIEGLYYNHVDSTTGTWNNLARSTYPEALKTPHVAAGSVALTPGIRRLGTQKLKRILMNQYPKEEKIAYMNVDQRAAWENTGINVTENIYQMIKGNESPDMIKEEPPGTFGGIEIQESLHANRGRIDVIILSHWGKGVTKQFGPFELGGQKVFQLYGASGGLLAGYQQVWDIVFNTFMDQPRYGLFYDGLAVPNGY